MERRNQLDASLGKKTSKRTEKEKLLEEEIVEEPPTSRRVNPQKRVLEKTRQKSVGPAEKRQKLTVTVVAEIHHSEEQQVPSQQQPEGEAVESVDTCISKSRLTSKPKHLDNFLSKTCVKNSETVKGVVLIFTFFMSYFLYFKVLTYTSLEADHFAKSSSNKAD